MEKQNSLHGHIIEISADVSGTQASQGGIRICGESSCGFSDADSSLKDAEERARSMRKLIVAVVLCIIFMSVEVAGGIKANSLAILTDAAHLLSDVAAFAISLFSIWASGWEATARQSYGFFRIEILGALVSIQMIWLLAGILVYEVIARIIKDTGEEVQGYLMFIVAAFGLLVNIVMAVLLGHDHGHGHGHAHDHSGHEHGHSHGHKHGHNDNHGDKHGGDHGHEPHHDGHSHGKSSHKNGVALKLIDSDLHKDETHPDEPLLKSGCDQNSMKCVPKQKNRRNINVHGAYLHVLGDSIQSIGVMISGAIIWYKPEWKIIDLICTLFFSVVVLATTIKMLRSILEVLMESTPREIDATELEKGLCGMDEVIAIHELHIWAITVGKVLLACHVKIKPEADADTVLDKVIDYIRTEFNISHVTIQIERQ
ncbi:Metal tolerance protein 1-like protein [Drosera capensis]